jgi:hypothetical protein
MSFRKRELSSTVLPTPRSKDPRICKGVESLRISRGRGFVNANSSAVYKYYVFGGGADADADAVTTGLRAMTLLQACSKFKVKDIRLYKNQRYIIFKTLLDTRLKIGL